MKLRLRTVALGVACLLVTKTYQLRAQEKPEPKAPIVASASVEGLQAIQGFKLADGLQGNLFAAEPMVVNGAALFVDNQGRVWVTETFRQEKGVLDNRRFDDKWLNADLASKTIEDRRKYYTEQLGANLRGMTEQDDRVRLLLDQNKDGVADESYVFADHFNGLLEGTAAGVLENDGNVYLTNIPNLWIMRDDNRDNKADSRKALHTGFGVRTAFRGHDLHGLRIGPDGRLYFSIGDRGANVETPNGRVMNVESGSVFRCELDGSNLEIFASGLRNPQELAFDEWGNLFTGDNNSDLGDQARWVYLVEGSDSGWRMAYQYFEDRGPFNRESIWKPLHAGQAAYIVPPIANISDGPSGLDYYPGTGFSDDFKGRFFLADFRGQANNSGIRSFKNEPEGAFFKLVDAQQPVWNILPTDVQFGPDGGLYICDWVTGWEGVGKSRIYRFVDKNRINDPIVTEVRNLLASSFTEKPVDGLVGLLGHADQRVRQKAQFELAKRKQLGALEIASASGTNLLARLHAIWAMDQIARADAGTKTAIRTRLHLLLEDKEAEVRAHATRLLGEIGGDGLAQSIRPRLSDANARVRYFASVSLRKLKDPAAFDGLVSLLANNDNRDPIIRHGGVLGLAAVGSDDQLVKLQSHQSVSVRLAAVVALRRKESEKVAEYLDDENPLVVLEAARAIHDVPIAGAMPALAKLIVIKSDSDPLLRRALNANYRIGTAENAVSLAKFVGNNSAPDAMRVDAINMLGSWAAPSQRDRVMGQWRPLEAREVGPAANALRPIMASLTDAGAAVRLAAARIAGDLGLAESAPLLRVLVEDRRLTESQRSDALTALAKVSGSSSLDAIKAAIKEESAQVRATGLKLLAEMDATAAAPLLEKTALEGEMIERQVAIEALGKKTSPTGSLVKIVEQLAAGTLAPQIHLEAMIAAEAFKSDNRMIELLAKSNATRDASKIVDSYRETLQGGNAGRGRAIFFERASVSCVRCHKIQNQGGEVGPDLTRIAADKNREYLLEALVDPNKTIAKNFESATIVDEDGKTVTGVVKSENDKEITLADVNANLIVIEKAKIEQRRSAPSAMPTDLSKFLTKSEIRDLVEFLAGQTGQGRGRGNNRPAVQ